MGGEEWKWLETVELHPLKHGCSMKKLQHARLLLENVRTAHGNEYSMV